MTAYYNEHDPYAAQWLRNLIKAGHIAPGDVDERSIEDVRPDELTRYTQCHFFAGIGVWSYALRRAGWPDDKPVWTGSCPCQPFSAAGKREGFADERHLWPAWCHLIAQCRPPTIFGEQVESKDGTAWLDLVQTDLEGVDYACGPIVLPAAGVGAPHIRHRLWFVAHPNTIGLKAGRGKPRIQEGERAATAGHIIERRDGICGMADTECAGPTNGFWRATDWLGCRDGKWRPVRPGTFPLAYGAPARVGRLRAYGNAINAEVATEFIRAYLDDR